MKTKLILSLILSTLLLVAFVSLAQAPATKPAAKPAAPAPQAQAQKEEPLPAMGVVPAGKTRFQGTMANTGGSAWLGGFFTLEIEQWTAPEEAAQLKQILVQSGQKAVLDKVWKAKQIGYLQVGNSMGKAIFFARAIAVPGGLVVRALTNSPLGRGSGFAGDYPFGYIELILPTEGKGSGTIVGMAQISIGVNGGAQVEAYGNLPVRIMEVGIEKKK